MDDEPRALVLDLGSGTVKTGFAGDDAPRAVFPTIVGAPKRPAALRVSGKESYVGDEAQSVRGCLVLRRPIENGIVQDWNALERILHHTFYNELRVAPEEHPVLVSEHPLSPNSQGEKLTQLMFETFSAPAFNSVLAPILSVFAAARRTTGTCVDIGDGVMTVMTIRNGFTMRSTVRRVHHAGRDLTHYLTRLLHNRGFYFNQSADTEIVRDLKEKLCYVALDYEYELHRSMQSNELNKQYKLPDEQIITLGNERFTCPEALFQPSLIGREGPGIHQLLFDAISSTDADNQKDLYSNILLSGGSTLFPGFADRLHKEITALAPPAMRFNIVTPPQRKYLAWLGGSMLASLSVFSSRWILREEYDEYGPNIITRKKSEPIY